MDVTTDSSTPTGPAPHTRAGRAQEPSSAPGSGQEATESTARTAESLARATDAGTVRGVAHRGTLQWRGIPYASPPVGTLRWRAPQPAAPWAGVLDGSVYGPAAPQTPSDPTIGVGIDDETSEDCLYLNVVTPAEPRADGAARPVVVFLHGGAFVMGASSSRMYRGTDLAPGLDVVYVSVNYRLGALGWLDLRGFGRPGRPVEANLGLRDQLAALEWVRRNISGFGGDPENVTVMGESAGAASVIALLASPASDGLFQRAVSQSGFASVPSPERAARAGERFVETLGGPDLLFDGSADDIAAATDRMMAGGGALPFGPVLDDVLPVEPVTALRSGAGAGVPLLIGTNRDEGKFFQKQGELLPTSGPRIDKVLGDGPGGDAVRAAYAGYARSKATAARLGGDWVFWTSTLQVAEAHAAAGGPAWMYRYDFAPLALRLAGLGATHGMELPYVFGLTGTRHVRHATSLGGRRAASRLAARMQQVWSDFASVGEIPWPAYDAATRPTWVFDRKDHLARDPDAARRAAWEQFRG